MQLTHIMVSSTDHYWVTPSSTFRWPIGAVYWCIISMLQNPSKMNHPAVLIAAYHGSLKSLDYHIGHLWVPLIIWANYVRSYKRLLRSWVVNSALKLNSMAYGN